jgi:uncharacterized protein (TIGR03435 family)
MEGRMKIQRWLLSLVLLLGMVVTLSAQTPTPTFDVASVKRAVPGTPGGRVQFLPGGRFVGQNVSLDFLLQQVYGVRGFQIVAAPNLRAIIADGRDSRYEIQAKGDESASPEQLKEMVKTLLAERFNLRLHKETRDLPVFALVPAKGGVKGARPADGRGGGIASMANGWIRGQGVTSEALAQALSRFVDRPVIDQTDLDRVLDFDLTWTPMVAGTSDTVALGSECPASFREMAQRLGWKLEGNCPSIFTAVEEQLGLKVEGQQAPVDVLVIDSVQQPTEN